MFFIHSFICSFIDSPGRLTSRKLLVYYDVCDVLSFDEPNQTNWLCFRSECQRLSGLIVCGGSKFTISDAYVTERRSACLRVVIATEKNAVSATFLRHRKRNSWKMREQIFMTFKFILVAAEAIRMRKSILSIENVMWCIRVVWYQSMKAGWAVLLAPIARHVVAYLIQSQTSIVESLRSFSPPIDRKPSNFMNTVERHERFRSDVISKNPKPIDVRRHIVIEIIKIYKP